MAAPISRPVERGNTSDQRRLVRACRRGDHWAWERLWTEYRRGVQCAVRHTLLRHRVVTSEDQIEELVAELFFRLMRDNYRRLSRFDGRCSLSYWLSVVAANLVVDWLRKRRADLSLDDPAQLHVRERMQDPGLDPETHLLRRRAASQMIGLLDHLSPRDQRFVRLFYGDGLPFEQVAEIMDTTVGALYSRKSRVGRRLRHLLRRRGPSKRTHARAGMAAPSVVGGAPGL